MYCKNSLYAIIFVLDQEPPEITCPDDIVVDDITTSDRRVNWQQPTATDNSGVVPVYCNRQSGDLFSVPGEYEVQCWAVDDTGNEATCSFRITLNRKYTAALKFCAKPRCSHSIENQSA